MTTQQVTVNSGRVATEGDDLYYEVYGQWQPGEKPALLMIPPGGGDGWHYAFVAMCLADEYRVITYDRRANARSTMNAPQNFEISQQSRDAATVLRALGETSALVFGNSSAAVIALDMAKTQPQAIRAVVAHEAPVARMHPRAAKWQRFFASVYLTAFRFDSNLAALQFFLGVQLPVSQMIKATKAVNTHREQSSVPYIGPNESADFLVKHELLPVTNYLPDIDLIKQNGVKVFIAVSEWGLGKKAWYAQVAQILAEKLGCDLVTFPGHHGAFLDMPDEFAAALRSVLHKAEG